MSRSSTSTQARVKKFKIIISDVEELKLSIYVMLEIKGLT